MSLGVRGVLIQGDIAEPHRGYIFTFMRKFHTDFHRGYTSLHLHLQWMKLPLSHHSCQHLSTCIFLRQPFWSAVIWNLKAVLTYMSLIANDFELFNYLLISLKYFMIKCFWNSKYIYRPLVFLFFRNICPIHWLIFHRHTTSDLVIEMIQPFCSFHLSLKFPNADQLY